MSIPDLYRTVSWYHRRHGRLPNLIRPTRFTEKIQLVKLRWRPPRVVALSDKVRAKEIVAGELGREWVTPTLYHGRGLPPRDERDWPMPFVVKTNNGSGGHNFVRNSTDLDWDAIEPAVARHLAEPHGKGGGEWVYRAIVPQVLVEPMLGEESAVEYKLMVFGGRVEYIRVQTGRFTDHRIAFFDRHWTPQPFTLKYPRADHLPAAPASLPRMIEGAEVVARGFPFLRVDFYEIEGRPRFSEATFYSDSGYEPFVPDEYDLVLGALWPRGLPTA